MDGPLEGLVALPVQLDGYAPATDELASQGAVMSVESVM
jgi:hypothetical protein